jgi:hypothetical protein
MATKVFKAQERVALAENISYRGYVYMISQPHSPNDQEMYSIQWDKSVCALYLADALITEKAANEIQAKIDAEKKTSEPKGMIKSVVEKFKEMIK